MNRPRINIQYILLNELCRCRIGKWTCGWIDGPWINGKVVGLAGRRKGEGSMNIQAHECMDMDGSMDGWAKK